MINGYLTGVLHVYFSEVLSKLDPRKSGLYNGLYGFFFGASGIIGEIHCFKDYNITIFMFLLLLNVSIVADCS